MSEICITQFFFFFFEVIKFTTFGTHSNMEEYRLKRFTAIFSIKINVKLLHCMTL